MSTRLVEIAVSGPMRQTFIYRLPNGLHYPALGQRVVVPFGKKKSTGYYIGDVTTPVDRTVKDVAAILDGESFMTRDLFDLCMWMSRYYFANPADVFATALAPAIKRSAKPVVMWSMQSRELAPDDIKQFAKPGKRLSQSGRKALAHRGTEVFRALIEKEVLIEEWPSDVAQGKVDTVASVSDLSGWEALFARRKRTLAPFSGKRTLAELKKEGWTASLIDAARLRGVLRFEEVSREVLSGVDILPKEGGKGITMTGDQQQVCDAFLAEAERGFSTHLLYGVTGSGKTLVYCRIAESILNRGKRVLILTPEIALTATVLAWFREFFGNKATVIHSGMSDSERAQNWVGIRAGTYSVVIGPRSALFAPIAHLGCIIVDEEHDGSYKQNDPSPRFHGRDAAIMRASILGIPVLLGSASPSLESFRNAETGKYRLHTLKSRPQSSALPQVHVVDMRKERVEGPMREFSLSAIQTIRHTLERNEQAIVFFNRRGYAVQLVCHTCGEIAQCRNCKVALTYHKSDKRLHCHYCGHSEKGWSACQKCESHDLVLEGAGTQKIEEQLPVLFPSARVARLDSDSVSRKNKAHTIIGKVASGECNLLVGTQMVTKGLDLPDVTLVVVLSADQSMHLPDFRASERTFSRLLQVAGRSGRAEKPGRVIIQTYNPDISVIAAAAAQDYDSFYQTEIVSRQHLSYPPFSRVVRVVFEDAHERRCEDASRVFADALKKRLVQENSGASVIGPAPCAMSYVRGRHRRHLFIKTTHIGKVTAMLHAWESAEARFGVPSRTKVIVDVDADDMI